MKVALPFPVPENNIVELDKTVFPLTFRTQRRTFPLVISVAVPDKVYVVPAVRLIASDFMPWYVPAAVEYTRTVSPFTSTVEPLVFALTAVPILNKFLPLPPGQGSPDPACWARQEACAAISEICPRLLTVKGLPAAAVSKSRPAGTSTPLHRRMTGGVTPLSSHSLPASGASSGGSELS